MNTYTLKATTTEEFFQAFTAHAIKIAGEPSYDNVRHLRSTLYENAASVGSILGGGAHGHLGMVMTAETYATIAPIPWVDPPIPPVAPDISAGATGPQISEINRAHAQTARERKEFQNLDRALLRQITESIEPLYLKPFHSSQFIDLLGKTTADLLTLLMNTYILPQELDANRMQLSLLYDTTSEPFQLLLERFEEAHIYAHDGQLPISDAQLINSGIVALKNTGILDRYIDLWTGKPIHERDTWLLFKQHFQNRILEYQKGKRSTAATIPFGLNAYCQESINSSMLPHTIIAEANHAAIANMAPTQTELLIQLAAMNAKFAAPAATNNNYSRNPRSRPDTRERGYWLLDSWLPRPSEIYQQCYLPKQSQWTQQCSH